MLQHLHQKLPCSAVGAECPQHTKASELVPCSLKFKHVTVIVTCTNLYGTMLWWRHVCADAVKFPKTWVEPYPYGKKHTTFSFPIQCTWGTRFKYLPEGCPYMLMYSALHIMQWFSHILDVFTPKIRRKVFDFNIFMNQNKRRLHKTWSDR